MTHDDTLPTIRWDYLLDAPIGEHSPVVQDAPAAPSERLAAAVEAVVTHDKEHPRGARCDALWVELVAALAAYRGAAAGRSAAEAAP